MQPIKVLAVTPLTRNGQTLSFCNGKKQAGVENTDCVKYISQIDAVAIGESNNDRSPKALVIVVSIGSDRQCKRVYLVTLSVVHSICINYSPGHDHQFGN